MRSGAILFTYNVILILLQLVSLPTMELPPSTAQHCMGASLFVGSWCGPSLCYHGNCTMGETPHGNPTFTCLCRTGWLGRKCDKCCDLPCRNGGVCRGTENPVANSFSLYCTCNYTHNGPLCEEELCTKQCVNGECEFRDGNQQACSCKEGFVGDFCEQPDKNKVPGWYWSVVGTVTVCGIVFAGLAAVMPYIMWRKRALIILKLHYYLKQYKDDESLRFDAFIACESDTTGEDMDFLLETLCPKLESDGYKICFGHRNFTYGKSQIDNTCVAISESRRTILILSPSFLADNWPLYQVQIAQHEALESAHRIIPIIFRKIESISNPTLRHIVSSLQCLTWPERGSSNEKEKFWKKLRVLMPKLNNVEKVDENHIEFVL